MKFRQARRKFSQTVKRSKIYKFFVSRPDEHRCLKGILGFFVGFVLGCEFYLLVLAKLDFTKYYLQMIGGIFIFSFAIGYAVSNQIRCIILLIIPTICSKNGRSYVFAFAVILLLKGPVETLSNNFGEINRSINCGTQLAKNLTKARASLSLAPLHGIMDDMKEQATKIIKLTKKVKQAFKPAEAEVIDDKEIKEEEKNIVKSDKKEKAKPANRLKSINKKYQSKLGKNPQKSDRVEAKYSKKLDLRCEGVFSMAVERCKDMFRNTEKKCKKKIPVVGGLLCAPFKLTFFCQLAKVIPTLTGNNCDSDDATNSGFGEEFGTAQTASSALENGFEANVQYQVVNNREQLTKKTPEDVYKAVNHEFKRKEESASLLIFLIERVMAFMFLRMLWGAYSYNKGYVSKFDFDNVYLTSYFRHIERRRKRQKKTTLFPLKKLEKKVMIHPYSKKRTAGEKAVFKSSATILTIYIALFVLVIFFDKIMHDILEIIRSESHIRYEQRGVHNIGINVNGTGAMAHLIRTLLTGLNQKHSLKQDISNDECLPRPFKTDTWIVVKIILILILSYSLTYLQAYVLRTRRLVAAFFYRKREKKRILFLYNSMLKKRKGFLQNAISMVKEKAKEGKLETEIPLVTTLIERCKCSPKLHKWLKKLERKHRKCLICKESIGNNGIVCPTKDCHFAYCKQCWRELEETCYSCIEDDEWSSSD